SLSAKYESGGRGPGTINPYKSTAKGDSGGASYGTYQISTSRGTMNNFLEFLGNHDSDMAAKFDGEKPGTAT
ncbi:unnamed protein product, partial [Rotaria sp. Silwood2]